MKPLPRTYDNLFDQLPVPIEFARALAWNESSMNPRNKTGSHWGLFQVGPENLADFNAAAGTKWTMDDMLDPAKNCAVWAWEYERIRDAITGAGVAENWQDRDFVSLVVAGWNSGYSAQGGVRKVLDYLKAKGLPLTHDNVFLYGKRAGAIWTLHQENPKGGNKYRWQRDVAAYYAGERAAAGDPAFLADLKRWSTKRIPVEVLTPPATGGGLVASSSTPLPQPEGAQGKTESGSGWLWLVLFGVAIAND